MSHDPIQNTIRQQAYQQAIAELPAYVLRRWLQLPKTFTPAMAAAFLRFQAMTPAEQMAAFGELYRRSTVLSIDRANQIADAQASMIVTAVEAPVA